MFIPFLASRDDIITTNVPDTMGQGQKRCNVQQTGGGREEEHLSHRSVLLDEHDPQPRPWRSLKQKLDFVVAWRRTRNDIVSITIVTRKG